MEHYLLFAGQTYYPSGGIVDYIGDFATLREAQIKGEEYEWAHIATLQQTVSADNNDMRIFFVAMADWYAPDSLQGLDRSEDMGWIVNGKPSPTIGKGEL